MIPSLVPILPSEPVVDPELATRDFLRAVRDGGLAPYPEQIAALEALAAGHHVILGTPTGSGKSLVALGLHYRALAEGRTSFYTSPTKALASEKFLSLCRSFGAGRVGMLTGDASVNRDAPVICCTEEVLANMTLRGGRRAGPPYVVMDEFHFYGDPERGVSWQVPLVLLTDTQFLLMSATLGDTSAIADRLERDTGRPVTTVTSDRRPVPLDFEYRETPLHETIAHLLRSGKGPVYVVSFTHRGAVKVGADLAGAGLATSADRRRVSAAVEGAAFDTPFGRDLRRLLLLGVGLHFAGMLPRYRLMVEQLAQSGLLKVISGTDTLGVGVNIPIRTVVFTALAKFDGSKFALLSPRDFRQIAGRAGRKGFDVAGSVVCQAPEHVIEARRARQRAATAGRRRPPRRRAEPGAITWNRETFDQLVRRPPQPLTSRFRVTHGILLSLLKRDESPDEPHGYAAYVDLVARSHEPPERRRRFLRRAAELTRALRQADIVWLRRRTADEPARLVVDPELQIDYSLHESLSLFLVEAVERLDPAAPDYHLDVVTFAEAIVEDPVPILRAQVDVERRRTLAALSARGADYEERRAALEGVTHPRPRADLIARTFAAFARRHPWVRDDDVHPKSIVREMFERGLGFVDYVERYGLQRSEGLLLRHMGQVYDVLERTVPDSAKTDELRGVTASLRRLVEETDASLLEAWERLAALQAQDGSDDRAT